jgi:diguanylate cyclase (GGDEF)-like protein
VDFMRDLDEIGPEVLRAARAFLVGGGAARSRRPSPPRRSTVGRSPDGWACPDWAYAGPALCERPGHPGRIQGWCPTANLKVAAAVAEIVSVGTRRERSGPSALRHFLRKRDDPYAGADMAPALRLCVPAWLITALVAVVSLALGPPSRLASLGWVLAGAAALGFVVVALWVRRRGQRTTFNELLVGSYLALGQIALLQWVTSGSNSPLGSVLLLWAVYTACIHPPRRTLPYLGFVALAAVAPFTYEGWDSLAAAQLAVELVLWFALAMFATHWTDDVRSKRLRMQQEGDEARLSARTDPLTGLDNRLALDEMLASELRRARIGRQPLSVVVVDLNGFKEINDRFGHLNGDECLREAAAALDSSRRGLDRCFRWGGDEFVMVLPDSDYAGAEDLAARLRRAVQTKCLRPDGSPLTIATGTAQATPDMDADELLGTADLALMGAKTRSRTPSEAPEP